VSWVASLIVLVGANVGFAVPPAESVLAVDKSTGSARAVKVGSTQGAFSSQECMPSYGAPALIAASDTVYRIVPWAYRSETSAWPTVFSPLNVQGLCRSGMWGNIDP